MLIAHKNFDGDARPTLFNVWNGLSLLGDAYSLGLTLLALYVFKWNWAESLVFYALIYVASGVLAHFCLEDVVVEEKPEG